MTNVVRTFDKAADKAERLAQLLDMNEAYVRNAGLDDTHLDTLFNKVARAKDVENVVMVPLGLVAAVCVAVPFLASVYELKIAGLILGAIAGLRAVQAGFGAVNTRRQAMAEITHAVEKRDQARLTARGPVSGDF